MLKYDQMNLITTLNVILYKNVFFTLKYCK